jgi:hypothetical protein
MCATSSRINDIISRTIKRQIVKLIASGREQLDVLQVGSSLWRRREGFSGQEHGRASPFLGRNFLSWVAAATVTDAGEDCEGRDEGQFAERFVHFCAERARVDDEDVFFGRDGHC